MASHDSVIRYQEQSTQGLISSDDDTVPHPDEMRSHPRQKVAERDTALTMDTGIYISYVPSQDLECHEITICNVTVNMVSFSKGVCVGFTWAWIGSSRVQYMGEGGGYPVPKTIARVFGIALYHGRSIAI